MEGKSNETNDRVLAFSSVKLLKLVEEDEEEEESESVDIDVLVTVVNDSSFLIACNLLSLGGPEVFWPRGAPSLGPNLELIISYTTINWFKSITLSLITCY